MTLAEARALLCGVEVIEQPYELQQDEAALRALASWALRFSPIVAPDFPDGLLLDVTGCQRLYGNEMRMLDIIGNALQALGFASRLSCAGTAGCAWAVARFSQRDRCIVEPGDEWSAIAPLPIQSLRIEQEIANSLHEVNVICVDELLAIPRHELWTRFGASLLRRIDQATGSADEVIQAIAPAACIKAEREFDGAILDLEALLMTYRGLLEEVCKALAEKETGAMRLEAIIRRLDATPIRFELRLSRACRDFGHLWLLLRARLEKVHFGHGIEHAMLLVKDAQPMQHRQEEAFEAAEASAAAIERSSSELIDTLSHRLGAHRALRMKLVESHCPERIAQQVPAMDSEAAVSKAGVILRDRPSQLFEEPEAIEVMALTPEGPPLWLNWRGIAHRIISAHGPERLCSEWWNASRIQENRDYFRVQDETGRWLWVFRKRDAVSKDGTGGGGWFVHGQWA